MYLSLYHVVLLVLKKKIEAPEEEASKLPEFVEIEAVPRAPSRGIEVLFRAMAVHVQDNFNSATLLKVLQVLQEEKLPPSFSP